MFEKLEKKYKLKYFIKDTVLVSYPKSGRTWLRMILARTLHLMNEDTNKVEFLQTHYMGHFLANYCDNLKYY